MNPLFAAMLLLNPSGQMDARLERQNEWNTLVLNGSVFRKTTAEVKNLRTIVIPASQARAFEWDESSGKATIHCSAVSRS